MKFTLFTSTLFLSALALAQTATAPAVGASVITALTNANNAVPAALSATVLAIISFAISEIGMRVFPTAKPKSWFIAAGAIFGSIGSLFTKISVLLDSLVQNLKDDPAPPVAIVPAPVVDTTNQKAS